ncbi:O-antigen ligase family protein [Novosphingobium aquae]|uniref:O-antigen ligase family protein n=1 Tax=Novosphingobium aquae TaxID=3133435 RepID=A0ABU8S8Q4_9SPHN
MSLATRANATLAYLVLVLLLGGASAASPVGNVFLQLLGAGLIGWALLDRSAEGGMHTGLRKFGIALAVLMAVQFVPLPPSLWQHLPGRDTVYNGFVLIGAPAPWLTLSLNPWHSLASFAWWIPAAALFLSMRTSGAPLNRHVIGVVTAVAALSVVFGGLQTTAGAFYFYEITNIGEGPGFFSNSNHQGSFLLCALALWGCWAIGEMRGGALGGKALETSRALHSGVALLLVVGVVVSGSLACQLLLIPVLASLALVLRPDLRVPLILVLFGGLLVLGGIGAFLLYGPAENDLLVKGTVPGISRQEFLVTGLKILGDFAPFGSGSGTFVELYRWYEDPAQVSTTFVNHAHDDLLELLIETGVFGLAALALFLIWFLPRAWNLWAGPRRNVVPLAASMIITTELLHSLVDYPLRTAAMSSIAAIACVLMVRPADPARSRSRRGHRPRTGESSLEMMQI